MSLLFKYQPNNILEWTKTDILSNKSYYTKVIVKQCFVKENQPYYEYLFIKNGAMPGLENTLYEYYADDIDNDERVKLKVVNYNDYWAKLNEHA